ncbi:hypothetical protein ACQ4PT_054283 [Festuca glaucescens]
MAYRRKQGMQRSATFVEDHRHPSPGDSASPATASPRATRFADDGRRPDRTLAAQTLVASAVRGDVPALAERFPAPASSSSPRGRHEVSPRGRHELSPRGRHEVSPRGRHEVSPRGRQVSPLTGRPGDPAFTSSPRASPRAGRSNDPFAQDPVTMLHTSTSGANNDDSKRSPLKRDEAKQGLWGLLAQQAKVMLDESGSPTEGARNLVVATSGGAQQSQSQSRWSYDRVRKSESPTFQEGGKLDIGGHIKHALEEGLHATMAENRTTAAGRKLQIRRKACSMDMRNANMNLSTPEAMSPMMTDFESPQIKASRDVANVMAAKVKLLQRELKTVKADMAFSKERCAQLEEENRLLRDGNHDADEDMIRQQLETLLAEKARLANENTVYARENRFLREIVDLHQLSMQDVVSLQEDIIEEEDEEEEDDDDTDQLISSPLCLVQEEPEHDTPDTPGTGPPQSPCHHADNVPADAPHAPCHHADNVPADAPHAPSHHADNVPAAAPHTPSRRTTDNVPTSRTGDSHDATIRASESPMQRNPQEDGGSLQMTRDNCSPERGTR